MLLGRVLTVFSLMPAREDFLGNLVFSTYYKDSSPVRIPSRVFSFVDSVSASLTRCTTRAAFPRRKNRLVELGCACRHHSPGCTCSDLGEEQRPVGGRMRCDLLPSFERAWWVQRGGTGQWPIKLTPGALSSGARGGGLL